MISTMATVTAVSVEPLTMMIPIATEMTMMGTMAMSAMMTTDQDVGQEVVQQAGDGLPVASPDGRPPVCADRASGGEAAPRSG